MGRPFTEEIAELEKTYRWACGVSVEPLSQKITQISGRPLFAVGSGGSLTTATIAANLFRDFEGGFSSVLVDPQGKPNHSEPARQGAGEMATRDHRELHSRSQGIPPPEVTLHDVKPGESLRAICRRYYGNAELADPLARYNGVPDPDVLQAEQRLRIPSAAVLLDPLARWDAGQEYTKAASSTDARPLTYTIRPGESLSEIAQRLLNSAGRWKQLYELNRDVLSDPNEIRAGTVITIPESGSGVGVRGSGRPAEP